MSSPWCVCISSHWARIAAINQIYQMSKVPKEAQCACARDDAAAAPKAPNTAATAAGEASGAAAGGGGGGQ